MRTVVIASNLKATEAERTDSYSDKIIKYLPGEAVALYITAIGLITSAGDQIPVDTLTWVVFAGVLVMLPLYLWFGQNVKSLVQVIITVVAYVLWILTLGGPFALYSWYHPIYGSLGVLFFTFIVPKIR